MATAAMAQAPPAIPLEKLIPLEKIIPTPSQPGAIALGVKGEPVKDQEVWTQTATNRGVRNVTNPTLTPVLPDAAKATGAAVIVAPGGGFLALSMDHEGYAVARWLADHGIAAFVLKYRLKPTPVDPAEYRTAMIAMLNGAMRNGGGDPGMLTPPAALEDAQAAVRLVRRRAAEWGVDPQRVGFVGFSAGAITTLSVGLSADKDARPDFIAPIYGPMDRRDVPKDAPPLFAALAADDPLFGKSDLGIVSSWRAAGRPYEVHVYEHGGHGFGLRKLGSTSDLWIDEFYAWMKARGFLGKPN